MASAVPRGLRPPHTYACGALAGLRTRGRVRAYWPSLPRPGGPSASLTAVVPTHRCGAVPEFHRVPSCLGRRGVTAEPAAGTTIYGNGPGTSTPHAVSPRVSIESSARARRPPPRQPTPRIFPKTSGSSGYANRVDIACTRLDLSGNPTSGTPTTVQFA
uniref:Uncharacterized protein n=1 Tax=Verrucosispora sp. MS100047 TaxID=1410949 RepID=A0A097CT75_9ACTN|nr:hypothetical protein VASRM7_597 [Verrucosispora sp. MS100047]